MSRLAYLGIGWDKMARIVLLVISQDNITASNSRLSYPEISLQRYSCHHDMFKFHSSPGLIASLLLLLVSLLLFKSPLST